MKRLDRTATIRPTPEANGYLKHLKNNGTFSRMIDAYMFAAAYALKNNLKIATITSPGRQALVVDLNVVDEDVFLALEAGVYAIRKRNGQPEPVDSQELLEIITQYAEAGLQRLEQRWKGKVSNQIQNDICKIISSYS